MNERAADISSSDGDRDEPGPSSEAGEPAEPEPARPVGAANSEGAIEVTGAPGVSGAIDRAWIRDRLRDAAPLLEARFGRAVERVTVEVIDDSRMIALQTKYHPPADGVPRTTDVLTFDLSSPAGPLVAEIAICADEARRNAAELGHRAERELLLYALHGLLHCMGLDDHDEEGFRRMHAEEDRILEAIGIGATFAAGESREAAP